MWSLLSKLLFAAQYDSDNKQFQQSPLSKMCLFLHKKRKSFVKILAPIEVCYTTLKLLLLPAKLTLLHCGIPDSWTAVVSEYYMSIINCKFIPPHEKLQTKVRAIISVKRLKKSILKLLLFWTTQRFSFVYLLQSIKVKDCITYYPSINHPGIRLLSPLF